MGALVELLSADASVIARTSTDEHGRYLLNAVAPGSYQLRASAAFLIPAMRSNLRLNAGVRAVANLTMTAIFEVGVWFPAERRSQDESSDDWRWTLRSSANRPLLRLADDDSLNISSSADHQTETVSQGRFAVLTGDGRFAEGGTHQVISVDRAEAGGRTEVLRANLGDTNASGGAASFSVNAGYERRTLVGGETRVVAGVASHPELLAPGASGLQGVTLASSERMTVGDAVMIDAGTLLSAERLVSTRVNAAPFLRIIVTPSQGIAIMYRYASARDLQNSDDLNNVQLRPEVLSDASGHPLLINGAHQELAISRSAGKDTETVAIYTDSLPVEALDGSGGMEVKALAGLPVIADASTGTFHVAVNGYTAHGLSASWTHVLTPAMTTVVQADFGSALAGNDEGLVLTDLNQCVHVRSAPAVSGALRGQVVRTGTTFRAQYRWQPRGTLDAVNSYNNAPEQAFLSFMLRQRLWSGRRLQGMDAVIEATNLLEEGYQPLVGPDGETLFLAQVPRAIQGGLSFSF